MDKCVSVIVPIYKVEPYLKRAVDSICRQTYSNLEIILVEDGSPDGCGAICDEYARKDNRIRVIHKENGGLSDARNAGLDIATGEYIAFVDSDDYIAADYVETLLYQLQKHDADVAMCSYAVTESALPDDSVFADRLNDMTGPDSPTEDGCEDGHTRDGSVEICDRKTLLSNLYDANHRDATYFIVSWNKIYKASLWEGVRFPKGKIHEDEATTYRIYDRACRGVYLHKPLYGYFSAPESITRSRFHKKRLDWMDALDDRIAYFDKQGDREQVSFAMRARADAAIHYYYPLKEQLPDEKEERKRLKGYVREEIQKEGKQLSITKRLAYRLFLLSAPGYRMLSCTDRDEKERIYQILFVILTAWLAFLCFYKLDVKYVDPWDESRHGVNAYEMLREGNLIRSTYLYETDYYNLKPPLSMWTIMASMAVFGKNIFAMRLPSVLCYLVMAISVAVFARKRYGRAPALLCLLFLSANTTPFLAHMVRAGDADSLYVLIFTLAMLCMLQIREKQQNLYWCGFLFALAFLTKSFHSGVIVVIGGLYLLLTGEFKRMKPAVWIRFIASALLPVGVWGILRYRTDGTAFLKEMWYTDVLGRSGKGFGSNEAGFGYYFSYYLGRMSGSIQIYLIVLVLILLAGILGVYFYRKKNACSLKTACKSILLHRDTIGFALWILVPVLAFSAVATKLLWYLYPAVTALLIAGAVALGKIVQEKGLPSALRDTVWHVAVLTGMIYSLILFGTFHNYGVSGVQTNEFQLLIQDTAQNEETEGAAAYVALETENPEEPLCTEWAQQDVFVAEAYGDYLCTQGGLDALLEDMEEGQEERMLFTTVAYFETQVLPALDDMGLLPEITGRRDRYLSVMIDW